MLKQKIFVMIKCSNHVVPSSAKVGWTVRKSDSTRTSKSFKRKEDAIKYGRELSKNEKTELYIHKKNGLIQDRHSYGIDPFPQKG